jgi:hypothetical protein
VTIDELYERIPADLRRARGTWWDADERSFMIAMHQGWARVDEDRSADAARDWDLEEILELSIPDPMVFQVTYRGLVPLRAVPSAFIDDPRLWLDNDEGDPPIPGPEVPARLRRDPTYRFGLPDWQPEEWR